MAYVQIDDIHLYSDKSQMASKCDKKRKLAHKT